jgi:hypothetical protein
LNSVTTEVALWETRETNAAQNNGECPQNFFLKSQSLAGGFFGPSSAGNRSVYLSADFNVEPGDHSGPT